MKNIYTIPPAQEDADKRTILLELDESGDYIGWRLYREGDQEKYSGSLSFKRNETSFQFFDGNRILIDSRDRCVLYAESRKDVERLFQRHPHASNYVIFNIDKIDQFYRVANPLVALEQVERRHIGKPLIDDEFLVWTREMLSSPSEWKKLLVEL